jgi:hypothetical protein
MKINLAKAGLTVLQVMLILGGALVELMQKLGSMLIWTKMRVSRLRRDAKGPDAHSVSHAAKVQTPVQPQVQTQLSDTAGSDFAAADRIVSIRLDPPVAVLNLRLFYNRKLIQREMIVTEQRLRVLMNGRHHPLGDVSFDPTKGIEAIKDDTVKTAQALINARGHTLRSGVDRANKRAERNERTPKEVAHVAAPAAKAIAASTPPQKSETTALPAPVPIVQSHNLSQERLAPVLTPYRPAQRLGVTFEGLLVDAGTRQFAPVGRPPYETFEATVQLENGVDVPLRGAELERELQRFGVVVGDRVAITPMGKVPVTLPSGAEGSKNVYKVAKLGGAAK